MSLHQFITSNNKGLQKQLEFKNFIVKNQTISIRRPKKFLNRHSRQITFGSTNDREIHQSKLPSLPQYDVNYQQVDKHQRTVSIKADRESVIQFTQENTNTSPIKQETWVRQRKGSLNLNEVKVKMPKMNLQMPLNYFDFEIQQPLSLKQVYHLFDILKEKHQIKTTREV
ncbi:unnamed protein product (macronuclear) [Paramecium tetraurelia]|uniref:Uncharacterized protein n=1 Tax=Paramecium tetraurelia TaxID=5888 RepID=A0CLB7_PARTE|nr:uncharacterized protein GSPATT00008132001 [Paramecium tetraurelia]CAK71584.1 unnamed protein product [Paramecium tetraurelia]|eukprot:XP_001438981.1 hypothetical protein (macronuclear) [Paramecium tetraurelia strain d4-2]